MYQVLLLAHSWLRWAALVGGVGAAMAAYRGPGAGRWGLALKAVLDLQLLVGLVLYLALSPATAHVPSSFDQVLREPRLRFWNIDHPGMMLAAVVLVHAAPALARRAQAPGPRRLALLFCYGAATLLMIAGTPWPAAAQPRPLFRWSFFNG